ncbi:MAG: universal stress protein [Bacteroidales bacterium]|nr:universal stress protein [Bacteroidales bacterium]
MERILIYIQKIDEAAYLIDLAASMAKEMGMDMDMLYTMGTTYYPMGLPGAAKPNLQYTEKQAKKILEEVKIVLENNIEKIRRTEKYPPKMEYFAEQGNGLQILSEQLKKKEYDFVLIGKQYKNEYPIDDRSIDIINFIDHPVWIMPENAEYKPLKTIVYATDYEEEDIKTMKELSRLAKLSSARIIALHISKNLDFGEKIKNAGYKDLLMKKVGYKNIEASALKLSDKQSLAESIHEYAAKNDAGLLVTLKENKKFIDRLFKSSTTKKLVAESDIPLLVFSEKKEKK